MIRRVSWPFVGVLATAILASGCSEPVGPAPPADGAKPEPVYSKFATSTATVKGKRQLNTTGPSPGKLVP
jgi:hypothetical protein